jgi:hypothetical protein
VTLPRRTLFDPRRYADALSTVRSHWVTETPAGRARSSATPIVVLGRVGSTQGRSARARARGRSPRDGRARRGADGGTRPRAAELAEPSGSGIWATVILRRGSPRRAPQP